MLEEIKKKLLAVPGVTAVEVVTVLHVYTTVNSPDEKVYDAVYGVERELIRAYQGVPLAFAVINGSLEKWVDSLSTIPSVAQSEDIDDLGPEMCVPD
jgi:hypothetical protein